jgi:hypothetical protein
MPDALSHVPTQYLALDDYVADFYVTSERLDGPLWKVERAQTFREPGSSSWEAFDAGRWLDALELACKPDDNLTHYFQELASRGTEFRRVRIVEFPVTPYLQWALHVIRTRVDAGERVRVVSAAHLESLEADVGRIPELVLIGSQAGYAVDYDGDGTPRGAQKFVDRQAITEWTNAISDLYERGEDFMEFFDREIAPLPPPPHADRV